MEGFGHIIPEGGGQGAETAAVCNGVNGGREGNRADIIVGDDSNGKSQMGFSTAGDVATGLSMKWTWASQKAGMGLQME